MPIYAIEQMRRLEAMADAAGHSYDAMMETAGNAVARFVSRTGKVHGATGKKVLVLAGPGNNGGDGLVAARILAQKGNKVAAITLGRSDDDARSAEAQESGVTVTTQAHLVPRLLAQADVVIDALFGTGLSRPITGAAATILEQLAEARRARDFTLVGVDGPSGLIGDAGKVDPHTVPSDVTIAFAGAKLGMLSEQATECTGRIVVVDIGIPAEICKQVERAADWLDVAAVASFLPKRSDAGHKGTFGNVMVVGGSLNYVGAPALAALAAGLSGAGLVTLAVPLAIHPMLASRMDLTSMTWLPLAHEFGALRNEAASTVHEALEKVTALVVGPGLGGEATTQQFVYRLLNIGDSAPPKGSVGFVGWRDATPRATIDLPPAVVDADALNALAAYAGDWWQWSESPMVLTPHPAELARLMKTETANIQARRRESAREAASRFGKVVVLKGARSVVAAPDGRLAVNGTATSALARGGTGDILAGMIGTFLSQGVGLYESACLAVVAHGRAGENLAAARGTRGILATDLLSFVGDIWFEFNERSGS